MKLIVICLGAILVATIWFPAHDHYAFDESVYIKPDDVTDGFNLELYSQGSMFFFSKYVFLPCYANKTVALSTTAQRIGIA